MVGREHSPSQIKIYVSVGNPGLAGMYEDFMTGLNSSLGPDCDTPSPTIWTFSHLGHHTQDPPTLPTALTYTLEQQIQHKLFLLEKLGSVSFNFPQLLSGLVQKGGGGCFSSPE